MRRILEHIGEIAEPPPLSPSRAPPEDEFEFDQRNHYADETAV